MSDPIRKMSKAERDMNRAVRQPQHKARAMKQSARRVAQAPGRQARRLQGRARQMRRMPGQRMQMMKNRAMRPAQNIGRQVNSMLPGAGGRRYQRRPDRMARTDFTISAMLYPFGFLLAPIGGMIADWDTAFIRYHLVHARMLAVLGFLFIPVSIVLLLVWPPLALVTLIPMFLLWGYTWYLGFQAYSGNLVFVPLLTDMAERQGKLDFETLEQMMGMGQQAPQGMPPPGAGY
ncbi:MAG: hypothetical protein GYB66_05555 [Chloroflexi bacterium]|nr:hypothetical protein [Chloroflexota bacterium]